MTFKVEQLEGDYGELAAGRGSPKPSRGGTRSS